MVVVLSWTTSWQREGGCLWLQVYVASPAPLSSSDCHSLELLQTIQVMRQPVREVRGFCEEAATAGRYLLWKVRVELILRDKPGPGFDGLECRGLFTMLLWHSATRPVLRIHNIDT